MVHTHYVYLSKFYYFKAAPVTLSTYIHVITMRHHTCADVIGPHDSFDFRFSSNFRLSFEALKHAVVAIQLFLFCFNLPLDSLFFLYVHGFLFIQHPRCINFFLNFFYQASFDTQNLKKAMKSIVDKHRKNLVYSYRYLSN